MSEVAICSVSGAIRHTLLAHLLFSLLTMAGAQSEEPVAARQKVLGKVVQLDGAPWARATVKLVAWPYPRYWFVGSPDVITVTADDSGRFEAELLPQRHYSAWAFLRLEGGGYRLTGVVDDVVPASLVELRERAHPQAPVRLRILEPEGAKPFGPLSFRVV